MKKALLGIFAIVAVILSSCSNKNADRLLKTVPRDTNFFSIINVDNLRSDLGENGTAELNRLMRNAGDSGTDAVWKYLLGEKSQVDFSSHAMVFELHNAMVITFLVKDGDAFRQDIEKATQSKFHNNNGIWSLDDNRIHTDGEQAWLSASYPEVTSSDIQTLIKLKKAESLQSFDYTSEMLGNDADIASVFNIQALMQNSMNLGSSLWINMLAEDARYVASYINFEKGKVTGEVNILNSKCGKARLSIKPSKINTGDLKNFQGKGNVFFATALDSDVVSRLLGQFKNALPLPAEAVAMLENIDGNIVVSANIVSPTSDPQSMAIMVTFKDAAAAQSCVGVINSMGGLDGQDLRISADGKAVYIMSPVQTGGTISDVAGDFNGACAALELTQQAVNATITGSNPASGKISDILLKLVDKGDSADLLFTVNTLADQNSLVTFLQMVR